MWWEEEFGMWMEAQTYSWMPFVKETFRISKARTEKICCGQEEVPNLSVCQRTHPGESEEPKGNSLQ